ncbi:glycine betaine ABC transporter substrate-binding protein [Paenarthrobacter sp. Z7-10]|uniref:glycine betaine ABC transporter substrate-binding protein n=1 Tax=Paenarthrobacter sp. Z7-10 TaxID=2787635 RepID=UPI0022A913C2|nr:glycine betaine ABC transporter substrate-binding protein [Paenarthrobacter sp. Z7-10]MCZ2402248.1 glycine betaine ABC transporter substrate-binding protein [Paenarthrobacter sp. Z7-10]
MRKRLIAAIGMLSVVLTSGCALNSSGPGQAAAPAADGALKGVSVNVGSKEFTEQLLLCEITAQRLESQGASVKRTCGMSGSSAVRSALVSGAIDTYWEYTGTGWLTHLQQTETINDPAVMYSKLSALDKSKNNIVWLPPASADNTYAIAVKSETAKKLGVSTISDYAKLTKTDPASASFCGASELFGRDDGWPGLKKAYGFDLPKDKVAELAEGPIYNAVAKGNPCNFGEAFATDGRIAALGLTVLTDDKHFFPPYNLSLNVRAAVLDKNPKIKTIMDPISKLLSTTELQKLNAQIDVDGKTPEEVASTWLSANKLK